MNGEHIASALPTDRAARRTFRGVYAKDETPKLPRDKKKYPLSFIVNTDRLGEPGEHWVAAYYTSPNAGEFFDSYGRAPSTLGFTRKRLPGIVRVNKVKLQSLHSNVCGQYCIYFIAMRARGRRSAAEIFTSRSGFRRNVPEHNDVIVSKLAGNNSR